MSGCWNCESQRAWHIIDGQLKCVSCGARMSPDRDQVNQAIKEKIRMEGQCVFSPDIMYSLYKEIENLKDERETLFAANKDHQKMNERLMNEIITEKQKVQDFQEELDVTQKALDFQGNKCEGLESKFAELLKSRQAMLDNNKEFQRIIDTQGRDIQVYLKNIRILEGDLEYTKEMLSGARENVDSLEQTIIDLTKERDEFKRLLDLTEKIVDNTAKDRDDYHQLLDDERCNMEKLIDKVNSMTNTLNEERIYSTALTSKIAAINAIVLRNEWHV